MVDEVEKNVTDEPQTGAPVLNADGIRRLGNKLKGKFDVYKSDRSQAEVRWVKNLRQRLGIYDPEVKAEMGTHRSKAYPKLTRVKCVAMLSKLMNLLFMAGEKNWTVGVSPVPNLHQDDLQKVLDTLLEGKDPNTPMSDEEIEEAIREFAKVRAQNLERLVDDQLMELGGNNSLSYTMLARKVLKSGIDYGLGVLRGPFVDEVETRTWQQDNGRLFAVPKTSYRPLFEFVPIWDYYPDMSAKTFESMEGQFQRSVMSKHQLIALKRRNEFFKEKIDEVLQLHSDGNYKIDSFENDLRAMGDNESVNKTQRGKYEVLMWEGHISGRDLKMAGINVADDRMDQDIRGQVWLVDNVVIRAELDPWSDLMPAGEMMKMYHHFVFEDDDTSLIGIGIPNIVRDSQLGLCNATRMTMDNGSVQRNLEVNLALLSEHTTTDTIETDKIWYRDDTGPSASIPAVRVLDLPMHLTEMQQIIDIFNRFADSETFVNPATGGDMQKGPSEPFRSASGASMIRGEAALPFKDVVRNFDVFTESVIGSILKFNKIFNEPDDVSIRGDFKPIARGATSLVAKEVLGLQLDNLASTLTEKEQRYINFRKLALARVRARDIHDEDIVVSDAEAKRIDEQMTQLEQQQQELVTQQLSAEIRKILAEAFKNVTQGTKNTASADAQTAQTILKSLEVGLDASHAANNAIETVAPERVLEDA